MRRQVHAVVVLRHRSDFLTATLQGLAKQTHQPTTITVVDLTADDDTHSVAASHLGAHPRLQHIRNTPTTGWTGAVNQARQALTTDSGEGLTAGWLWVLRDDTEPEADALAELVRAVDQSPSVVIAGPKQRMADQRKILREFGETLGAWGQRQAIVDRELDQAQYDRMSDVLAVGDAGMLIDISVFDALGGFDAALDPLDAPLDIGVRARLAGHRVLAVPTAVVYVGQGPADWRAGVDLSAFNLYRLDRTAWLYRRFVYSSWWLLLPIVLTLLPLSIARAVVFFVTKRPDTAIADLIASMAALALLPRALGAKTRLSRTKTASWSAIRPLRMAPAESRRRRQLLAEEKFAQLEEKARLRSRPSFWPGGLWMVLGLGAMSAIVAGPLLGARALGGGGLLPLSAGLEGVWSGSRWLQPDAVQSMWGNQLVPADPAVTLFALVGSITWWEPSQAIVWLWGAAIAIAGLIAWWAASQMLSQSLPTTLVALVWALSPTFLMALADGRIGAVIAHLALPWLLASSLTAYDSWQRAAQAGIATAVVVSAAPVLWPAVLLGWLVVLVATGWRTPLRTLVGTLPLVVLPSVVWWLPRVLSADDGPLLPGLGRWLADPGVATSYQPSAWWLTLAGWPAEPTAVPIAGAFPGVAALVAAALAVPLLLLALAVLATPRTDGMVIAATLIPLGMITAVIAPEISQGFSGDDLVALWPGSAVSLLVLGVVMAAAITLDHLHPLDRFPGVPYRARQLSAWAVAVVVVGGVVLGGVGEALRHWNGTSPVEPLAESRLVPALIAADAPQYPRQGILIVTDLGGTQPLRVEIERGAGPKLDTTSTLYRQRLADEGPDADDLAFLAAALVQPTSDEVAEVFDRYDIRFVLYRGDTSSARAAAISRNPALIPAGQTDQQALWQLVDETMGEPVTVARNAEQVRWDVLALVVLGLWGILALPTERRPRHRSTTSREDETLSRVLEEGDDER